jgi:xanthine dehydrogenase large subunit
MFVIEAAIALAADKLGVEVTDIQQKNLCKTGDEFAYGQKVISEANACWQRADALYKFDEIKKSISQFNNRNTFSKKGFAVMPICFGISFTNTMMNNARSLVHVYADGSVNISTGAVEMGQVVNTKIAQVAAHIFSLPMHKIRVNSTNTFRVANTSPSAASATADLNGKATQIACEKIAYRLKNVAAQKLQCCVGNISIKDERIYNNNIATEITWNNLLQMALMQRISLSENAHYSTPEIHFDKTNEKGHPFAYHVFGTAAITATIDTIRGIYEIDEVKVVHDYGNSMNMDIDRGQIEGGIVQGIGWMTMEEVVYDNNGKLRSNALSTYKVPDVYSVPKNIEIENLQTEKNNLAIFNSKAVGEPPLMYGIGAYFALQNAIKAFNNKASVPFDAPMTPEKVLMNLYATEQ